MNGSRALVGEKIYEVSSFDPILGVCSCAEREARSCILPHSSCTPPHSEASSCTPPPCSCTPPREACTCTPPHTLLVGTMPSITSHGQRMYYGHPSNAFWWIAGDALGWRRGGPRADQTWPYQWDKAPAKDILAGILHAEAPVLPYSEQVSSLTKAGFALWDIVKSCTIKNSDDTSIKDCQPNDIPGLLTKIPSINKIVFASGKTSAMEFVKMQRDWLRQPNLFSVGETEFSHAVFDKIVNLPAQSGRGVQLLVPHSVSPAAASVRYEGKRDQWLNLVFGGVKCGRKIAGVSKMKTPSIVDMFKMQKSRPVYGVNGK